MGTDRIVERAATPAPAAADRDVAVRGVSRAVSWTLFLAVIAIAWWALPRHAVHHGGSATTWPASVASWALMTIAMMVPTAVPVLRALWSVVQGRRAWAWWMFLLGYVTLWLGYSVAAATLQWTMSRSLPLDHGNVAAWWSATVVLVAGLYQFTSLKRRCLDQCVAPMTHLLRHWRDGLGGAWRMGVDHGVICIGCCAALMALGMVGGIASWWFMPLATAVMVVEKLPSLQGRTARPLGAALVVSAAVIALFAFIDSGAPHPSHERGAEWLTGPSTAS